MAAKIEIREILSEPFALEPIDDKTPKREVKVTFAERTRTPEGGEAKVGGWWIATVEIVFDGATEVLTGEASKPKAAIEKAIKSIPGAATLEDYAELDYDADFFKQSLAAPAEPEVSFDAKVEGTDQTYAEIREGIEHDLAEAAASEETALDSMVRVGVALNTVYIAKGRKIPAVKAFLEGRGLGDNALAASPLVTQLGKGTNAIQETIRFGQADKRLIAVTSPKRSSGKGFEKMKNDATKVMIESGVDLYMKLVERETAEGDTPVYLPRKVVAGERKFDGFDGASAAKMVKCMVQAADGFNVENATDMKLDDLPGAVDARAESYSKEFLEVGGKRFNPYVAEEYKRMQKAFIYNLHAYEGSDLPGAHGIRVAIEAIKVLHGHEETGSDQKIVEETNTLHGQKGSTLIASAQSMIEKRLKAQKVENERAEIVKQTEGEDDNLVNQKVRKQFADLTVTEAALKIARLVANHPSGGEVLKEAGALYKQIDEQKGGTPTEEQDAA